MNKEILLELKKVLNKEIALETLALHFNISELEALGMINQLRRDGDNILSVKKNGDIYIIDYGDNFLETDSAYYINIDKPSLNLAIISDTRLCSKYQQLSILNDIYLKAKDLGVTHVLHCGDISEGIFRGKKSIFNETLFLHGVYEQGTYISENYPYVEGIETLFITGEHDQTHIITSKTDIGKIIDKERPDMKYLGKNRKRIIIKNSKNKELLNMLMLHPTGKIPYTISYKPQRYISAMRSEDKTNILLHGHWLQTERLNYRDVIEYSVPSVIATTPEMDVAGDQNTIGAWILKIEFDENNKKFNTSSIFMPYYQTIVNDYKTCKTLKIGGKK